MIIYTVKELIEELSLYKGDQKVFVIGRDKEGKFLTKSFYKTEQDADEEFVYLYLGDTD